VGNIDVTRRLIIKNLAKMVKDTAFMERVL